MRIALGQINLTVGDLESNAARIVETIAEARGSGADLVSVPELALSGYPPEDLLLKPRFLRDCQMALATIADQCSEIAAVVGFPDAIDGKVYNAAALIHDRRLVGVYHKIELPNYGVFDERRYFQPGAGCLVFALGDTRVLLTICEDIWIEGDRPESCALAAGAEVVLNISASPFHAGKLALRREIAAGFARRTGAIVAYNNLVGGQDELIFDGGSLAMSPEGELLASAPLFEEHLLLVDLEPARAAKKRGRKKTAIAGSPIVQLQLPDRLRPPLPPGRAPELARAEEVYRALTLGVRDYVRKNGFKKVVIGLSGGIDSALTAAIAVEALGRDNVIGVTMPSPYSSAETRSDAALLAGRLGIGLLSIPINAVFAACLDALRPAFGAGPAGIENENLQARIRGNFLMALSNRFGWLVLTTANKSETAVGYSTLYGDMAGGFAVIKDVPKTLVYELADYLNGRPGGPLIPPSIVARAPTAELRPGQKDEDSLPPYPVLDPILQAYVEHDLSLDEIVALGYERELVLGVIRMVDKSEYKRRQGPPGIKITPKAFGRDRRLPITNAYRQR